jgi:hypothetical protein
MRPLIFLFIVVLVGCTNINSGVQAPPNSFRFGDLIEVPGASKEYLYNLAMIHLAKTYVSSSSVIQYASQEHGRIIGRARMSVTVHDGLVSTLSSYSHSIDIEVVDGKVRYYYDDFSLYRPAMYVNELLAIKEEVDDLKIEMRRAILSPSAPLKP